MIALTTFRVDEKDITTDPTSRTDGDTTAWLYDDATGLELKKPIPTAPASPEPTTSSTV